MNPRRLAILAGLAGSLLVTGAAGAAFVGTHLGYKRDSINPRLLIFNLLVDFSDPGDRLLSLNGLPGNPMFFSTNSSAGFHQEQFFGADKNFAITAGRLGAVPAMRNDTYVNIGIKSGQVTSGGVAAGTADDYSPGTPAGVLFGWNDGGRSFRPIRSTAVRSFSSTSPIRSRIRTLPATAPTATRSSSLSS